MIRYGNKGKKSPKQRFVLLGKVVKVGKHGDNYKIEFKLTNTNERTTVWFSVENIANFKDKTKMNTKSNDKREYRQSKKKLFQKDLLIPLSKNDRINSLQDQGYSITYDPPGDGDCQFNALTRVLSRFGMHRSVQTVREFCRSGFEFAKTQLLILNH